MESIYKPTQYACTKPISLKEVFKELAKSASKIHNSDPIKEITITSKTSSIASDQPTTSNATGKKLMITVDPQALTEDMIEGKVFDRMGITDVRKQKQVVQRCSVDLLRLPESKKIKHARSIDFEDFSRLSFLSTSTKEESIEPPEETSMPDISVPGTSKQATSRRKTSKQKSYRRKPLKKMTDVKASDESMMSLIDHLRTKSAFDSKNIPKVFTNGPAQSTSSLPKNQPESEPTAILKLISIKPLSEFAVSIRVYKPFRESARNVALGIRTKQSTKKFSHEIIALGSNTLAEVRDKIMCVLDLGLFKEVDHPIIENRITASKEQYPSGFLFIDDVFYNDTRSENVIDYSEVLRDWASRNNITSLKTAELHKTRIDDLSPRFGYPYVYQHQGDCEHVLVFSSGWLLTRHDNLVRQEYPRYGKMKFQKSKYCTLCLDALAIWIIIKCDYMPHDQTFLCQHCIQQFFYDKESHKIGTFKLYPYFQFSNIDVHNSEEEEEEDKEEAG